MSQPVTTCPDCRTVCLPPTKWHGRGHRIVFCPLHQSAGQLREALLELVEAISLQDWKTKAVFQPRVERAKHALAASEGKEIR